MNALNVKSGTLVEIRPGDFAHRIRLDDGGVEWLTGRSRAKDVREGDRVTLTYRTGNNFGLWFATRETTEAAAS